MPGSSRKAAPIVSNRPGQQVTEGRFSGGAYPLLLSGLWEVNTMWCANCGNIGVATRYVSPKVKQGRGSVRCLVCSLVIGDWEIRGGKVVTHSYYSQKDWDLEQRLRGHCHTVRGDR